MSESLRIGSRRSRLALTQSELVQRSIEKLSRRQCQIIPVDTKADLTPERPLPEIGAKGLFTAELEEMLIDGRIDIAVHSLKDLPTALPAGLTIGAIGKREDPRDVMVSNSAKSFDQLSAGARVGTGSIRRAAQLKSIRPDVMITPIRGNVPTRLDKLDAGDYDGIILAAAGLNRLNLSGRITYAFSPAQLCPAPGQGALGIECRADDNTTIDLLESCVHDPLSALCCHAERLVLAALDSGCNAPLGVHAQIVHGELVLRSVVAAPDGSTTVRSIRRGPPGDAELIAHAAVQELIDGGADRIIAAARES